MSSLGYEYVHLHAIPNPAGWFEHIVTASRLRCWKLIWPHTFFHIRTNLEYTTDGTPPVKNVTKVYPILTLVYWNVSCLPVNVASMECGEVSIWQIPGAAHRFKHGCASLISWWYSSLQVQSRKWILYRPAQVMRARCEPVKVRLNTKSFAEFARHWAKPRIARMGLVLPLAAERQIGRKLSRLKTRI